MRTTCLLIRGSLESYILLGIGQQGFYEKCTSLFQYNFVWECCLITHAYVHLYLK